MLLGISLVLCAISLCLVMYIVLSPGLKEEVQTSAYFRRICWLWPWVTVLSAMVMPFVSWVYQKKIEKLIGAAAYQSQMTVRDIVGLQALGVVLTSVGLWLLSLGLTPWVQWLCLGLGACLGAYLPLLWLRQKMYQRQVSMLKAFPFFLDMVTLCVEAGSNLQTALMTAVNSMSEGPLRDELQYALNDMRTGNGRIEALKAMSMRCDLLEVKQWVSSLAQAELLGTSLGTVLRAQSDQFRQERFIRAEKQAAKTPVKLLFPLICFIFPCTFIVIGFPIVMRIFSMDIL